MPVRRTTPRLLSVAEAIDSKGGFTIVLAAAKALWEHGVVLTLVADAHLEGFGP